MKLILSTMIVFALANASPARAAAPTHAQYLHAAKRELKISTALFDSTYPWKANLVQCDAYSLVKFICELRAPAKPGRLKCYGEIIYSDGFVYEYWWMVCRGSFTIKTSPQGNVA